MIETIDTPMTSLSFLKLKDADDSFELDDSG